MASVVIALAYECDRAPRPEKFRNLASESMMIPDEAIDLSVKAIDLSVKAIDLVIQWTYSVFKLCIQVAADFPKETDKRQTDGAYPNKLWTHSRSSSFRLASILVVDLVAMLTCALLTWPSFLETHPTSTESAIRSGRLSPMGQKYIVESHDRRRRPIGGDTPRMALSCQDRKRSTAIPP